MLLQERIEKTNSAVNQEIEAEDPTKDLELVASISNSKLTITFRKSISGIHQKLGELSLSNDPSVDINVLDWTNTAIARADALQSEAHDLQRKLAAQTQTIKQLNQQLEDLIQAKKDHEDALLQKCAILLNEKKAKIRDQQRLLATAKVDPMKLKEVQNARQSSLSRRNPDPSRVAKRKALAPAASSDEGDGFEDNAMEIEERAGGEEEEQPDSEQVTPQHSDLDETDDEVDAADLDNVPAPQTAKGKVIETVEVNGRPDIALNEDEDMEMPPRRDLPFVKDRDHENQAAGGGAEEHNTKIADDDDDDDDETDDEL